MEHHVNKHHGVHLGIDIGGTSVKFCACDDAGAVLARGEMPTPQLQTSRQHAAFAQTISQLLDDAATPEHIVSSIGIAVPGAIDARGDVELIPNAKIEVAGFRGAFASVFPKTTIGLLNDANAAALGEQWLGAARGERDVLLITLGTGVGAGVVSQGRVIAGAHGCAGEIGHLRVEPGGHPCACGGAGCLEQYASAPALVRMMREACKDAETPAFEHDADARALFSAFAAGDARARSVVETFADKLGFGLANAVCAIDPEIILIGGGVSGAFDLFESALVDAFRAHVIPPCVDVPIRRAALGNDAGMIGAARHAMVSCSPDLTPNR